MDSKALVVAAWSCLSLGAAALPQNGSQVTAPERYNTVKAKLAAGQQVVGVTVLVPDADVYCAVANSGFDFTWIEMQHSPLAFQDVARMLMTCRGAAAVPFIRVPDATESDIQKATDIGALGIIVPMVDTVEKAEAAVRFAKSHQRLRNPLEPVVLDARPLSGGLAVDDDQSPARTERAEDGLRHDVVVAELAIGVDDQGGVQLGGQARIRAVALNEFDLREAVETTIIAKTSCGSCSNATRPFSAATHGPANSDGVNARAPKVDACTT